MPDPDKPTPDPSSGEVYNLSGDFRGATVNIQSTIVGAGEIKDIESLPPDPGVPPYLGLSYFDERDAGHFFGRERLTARLAGRLAQGRFLAVIGDSGSGKSSLVRAGLIPALRRGAPFEDGSLPPAGSAQWEIRLVSPTAHPLQALAACLAREEETLSGLSSLESDLRTNPAALVMASRRLLARSAAPRLLLVIDQFEELFAQCRQEEERTAFLNALFLAVDPQDDQPISVVIVLRADFYARLSQYDRLRELVSQRQEFIGAMNRDELFRTIVAPAAQGNWKIQEGLVEVMLADAGGEPGALPLLSHALLETWLRRRGRTMTLSGYTEAGGVRGAIAHTAETVFRQRLTSEQQPIARMIFTRLAELDDDAQDTRRRASFSELITRSTDAATIDAVLAILTEARLVTTGTLEPGSVQVIEVAHEALIREWPTLRQWLNENRAGLLLHQKMADDAAEWLRLEKDPGALYRGLRLEQAAAFSEQNLGMLSLEEQDFLDASRQAAAEETGRERRYRAAGRVWRVALPALGILLLVGLGVFFYVSKLYVGFLTPLKMDSGAFNIAVAEFGQIGPDGVDRSWAEGGSAITSMIANALKKEMQADPNLLVWQDSPALADHNTRIGRPLGSSPAAQMVWAEQTAKRLNADMLIFGNLEVQDPTARLVLQVYITPNYNYQFEDIQGSFQQGDPIGINSPAKPGLEAEPPVTSQASTFAWLAIGLTRMRLGQPAQALEAFRKAETFSPGWAVIQFFIGRESLFLSDQDSVHQDALTGEALQAFQKALGIDPQDVRSEIGLGSVYFAQAKRLVAAVPDGSTNGDARLAQAANLAAQARQTYGSAGDLPPSAQNSAIPLKEVAQLGVGTTLRLEGEIQYRQGQEQQARQTLQQSAQVLQSVQNPFEMALQERYLAQSFEALGTAYQWLGFLDERGGDFPSAKKNYTEAVKQYNNCAQLAKQTPDLILSRDIVDQQCVPYRDELQKRLDSLKGSS